MDANTLTTQTPTGTTVAQPGLQDCPTCGGGRSLRSTREPCPTCGALSQTDAVSYAQTDFVYALGRIEPRFPSVSIEKELAQIIGRAETPKLTDRQALHKVLSDRSNLYIVRQLCWVMTISGLETYIILPHDSTDFGLLVDSLKRDPSPINLDAVIGVRGALAPLTMCNGMMVPIVRFSQLYSFDRDSFIKSIPRPEAIPEKEYREAAKEVFDRILQMTDNKGATDQHRALNYLAVRYPSLYEIAARSFIGNSSLSSVDTRISPLSSSRRVIDVILSFTSRTTGVIERFACRVDVTDEFPFLVTRFTPYFEW